MTVIDIKFRNDEAYLLKHHDMTLAEFEKQISEFNYNDVYEIYRNAKDENGVEKEQFPPINYVFYTYIFLNMSAPAPTVLAEKYFKTYNAVFCMDKENDCIGYKGRTYQYSSVMGRILRTYPSLIRDFHFFLLLKESNCFEQVIYSCKDDITGKDITVKHNGKKYELSLLVDTGRSNFFKKIKNTFRHKYGSNEIQLRLNLKNAAVCGDFFLYDKSHLNIVKEKIL